MPHHLRLCTAVLLAASLAACSSTNSTSSRRDEHHYAFGSPTAPSSSSGVTPVVAPAQPSRSDPTDLARVLYFDFDSDSIRSSDRDIVEAHAQWLRNNPLRFVTLRGNTDARGGTEYNLALGQKRAEAVRQSLQLLGVRADRIEAVSYGEERLTDQGSSEEAHQRNRRVEFDGR